MTTTVRTGVTDVTLTGTREEIQALLEGARTSGRLLAATAPQPVSPTDPRLRVVVWLHPSTLDRPAVARRVPSVSPPARHRSSRYLVVVGLVLVVIAAVTGLALAVAHLVVVLAANAALVLGVLLLVGLAMAGLRSSSRSARHCPGAYHR